MGSHRVPNQILGVVVKQCLDEGQRVNLDGLGVFTADGADHEFIPSGRPKVFISYVNENLPHALEIYHALERAQMNPWLDRKKLMPGQNWKRCIERAIDTSDFFVACFSPYAVQKRGQFPYEVRHALRCQERMPLDDTFIFPVRTEPCRVPDKIMSSIHYVDLFPERPRGLANLVDSIEAEWNQRLLRDAA